ncbi:putative internal virion protein [Caudoviricetes sp.]|nr:putative internal virion protein [Caudoviricetes sp.]
MADISQLFADMERKYNLPAGYLNRTYQIESNSGQNLFNKNSGAAGPFQFIPKTAKAYGLDDPYDINASSEAAAKLAADNRAALQASGIKDPSAAHLYLAHQQGAGGASGLLNSDKPASSVVGEKAVSWNGGQPDQTGSQFASGIMNKFNSGYNAGQSGQAAPMPAPVQVGYAPGMDSSSVTTPPPESGGGDVASGIAGLLASVKDEDWRKAGKEMVPLASGLLAAGAPKSSAAPAQMAQIHRPQANPNLFAGLLRNPWNV